VKIFEYLDGLVDQAEAAGIRATIDSRNVNPPCVLFAPATVTLNLNCGGTAAFEAICIVPGPGNADAYKTAHDLAASLVEHVLPQAETLTPGSYGVDENTANPAMIVGWTGAIDFP
jgi:hypothetical protein